MRKTLSLITAVLLVISMLILTGCTSDKIQVASVLNIDSDFVGNREITIKYPLDTNIDEISQQLLSANPLEDTKTSSFEYLGVLEDGYTFVLDVAFSSHDEYISQMSTLVGREVSSDMAQPSTVFTKGTRMVENFDVSDVVHFVENVTLNNKKTKNLDFDYYINTVNINGVVFNTGSTIDISQREGHRVNSITVATTNLKDGTYDREISFSIPNQTYVDLSGSIEQYFTTNTSPSAQYCDFTNLGSSWEYKVIYKGITLEELKEYTAMLLDTDSANVFYGDKDNSSTPLSEGLTFEETFNTFSFIGADGDDVDLIYQYALPIETTHSDGALFLDGQWQSKGKWEQGVYSVSTDSDVMNIRIPDGIQYSINGINFDLNIVGKNSFVRTTDFLYSKTQGYDGMKYAQAFFESKGADVEITEDEDNLICRVVCTGDAETVTDELTKYFGSGNLIDYHIKDSSFKLSAKTEFVDYINLSQMLNSNNANRPMTYTVHSSCEENVTSLVCGDSGAEYADSSNSLTVPIINGKGTVYYEGNIPNTNTIIVYITLSVVLVAGTIVVIVLMLLKRRSKTKQTNNLVDSEVVSLEQTTTFSITELNNLSDMMNKKLKEEIDKDIEDRIEADRLENLKKELKAKEIAELERMIYGTKDEQDSDDIADADTTTDTEDDDI